MSNVTLSAEEDRLRLHEDGFVTFRLADQWLGVPVVLIQEVLTAQIIAPVPRSPAQVAGFLNLRGQIVTAVDLRVCLGLPRRDADDGVMNVVVRDGEELFSLIVDKVGDVVEVEDRRVEPAPGTLPVLWREVCTGVIRLDEGLLVILDVEAVLRMDAARAA